MPILVAVVIDLVVAAGVYRLIAPKGDTATAVQMGRRWCAWMAILFIITFLTPLLYKPFNINSLATFIAGMIVWPGIAFLLGWAYGMFRFRKVRTNEKNIEFTLGLTTTKLSRILLISFLIGVVAYALGHLIGKALNANNTTQQTQIRETQIRETQLPQLPQLPLTSENPLSAGNWVTKIKDTSSVGNFEVQTLEINSDSSFDHGKHRVLFSQREVFASSEIADGFMTEGKVFETTSAVLGYVIGASGNSGLFRTLYTFYVDKQDGQIRRSRRELVLYENIESISTNLDNELVIQTSRWSGDKKLRLVVIRGVVTEHWLQHRPDKNEYNLCSQIYEGLLATAVNESCSVASESESFLDFVTEGTVAPLKDAYFFSDPEFRKQIYLACSTRTVLSKELFYATVCGLGNLPP